MAPPTASEKNKAEAEIERVLRRVMAMMVIADGHVDDNEIDMMRTLFERATGRELSIQQVKADVRAADGDTDVARYLRRAGLTLNLEGKRGLMECKVAIAKADGVIAPEERKLLSDMAKALDLTRTQIDEILHAA